MSVRRRQLRAETSTVVDADVWEEACRDTRGAELISRALELGARLRREGRDHSRSSLKPAADRSTRTSV